MNLDNLRLSISRSCEAGNYNSALFWIDKLLSLSKNSSRDVVLYVQTLIASKQHLRALCFLRQRRLIEKHRVFRYFAVECLLATKQFDEAVKLAEGPLTINNNATTLSIEDEEYLNEKYKEWRLDGVLYLHTGRAYEELDNRPQAADTYSKCLLNDVFCYEAFSRLNKRHLLTLKEKLDLIDTMPFDSQCADKRDADFVRYIYATMIQESNAASTDGVVTTVDDSTKSALEENFSLLAAKAERLYYSARFVDAYKITSKILKSEEFFSDCLIVHICLLVNLDKINELFKLAHKLVDTFPESHVSWYAVACYYVSISNCDAAKRFFHKCTLLDPQFGEGWVGYGHSFAVEQEHDQAMNSYVKAAKLMSSCHIPLLYVGLEYSLTNNLKLGEKFLQEANAMAPDEPQILHEMGVLLFRQDNFVGAEKYFRKALEKVSDENGRVSASWEALLNNMGHTLRKLKKYEEALYFHSQALIVSPKDPSTLASMAYLFMFLEKFDAAIEHFHQSLSLRREDSFVNCMLTKAMEIMCDQPPFDEVPKHPPPSSAVVFGSKKSFSKTNSTITGADTTAMSEMNQSSVIDVDMEM